MAKALHNEPGSFGLSDCWLLQGVQEIVNSYMDQQQELEERRDVIAREEGLENRKAEKARTNSAS